ncbi:MAG: ABC transporter permease, partial [Candidatus Competibacterales bacterium]|nr:ABC transporter permease [Candidatus Competibacterales bacterium]
ELANGLSNLMSWPMVLLSGIWFSLEGAPTWVQQAAQLLPLTHMVDATRAVMIDGAGLVDVADSLAVLAAMTVLFLALGARLFRWE